MCFAFFVVPQRQIGGRYDYGKTPDSPYRPCRFRPLSGYDDVRDALSRRPEAEAIELTRWAVDQGVNFIDTANMYEAPHWMSDLTPELSDQLERIEQAAKENGRSLAAHAILSVLEQPAVVSAILGVKGKEQLRALLEIVRGAE